MPLVLLLNKPYFPNTKPYNLALPDRALLPISTISNWFEHFYQFQPFQIGLSACVNAPNLFLMAFFKRVF